MITRKEMKKRAKHSLKRHYWVFVAACLIAAFIGTEFSQSLSTTNIYIDEGAQVEGAAGSATSTDQSSINTGMVSGNQGLIDAVSDALHGDVKLGMETAQENAEKIVNESTQNGNQFLGRSRGVLASFINSATSGSFLVKIISAMNGIFGSGNITFVVLIILSLLFSLAIWVFVVNMYQVISRRIFLEGRIYDHLPIQRFLFLLRTKKWMKVSMTMLLRSVYTCLWALTIVGGVIKHYSYYLVPYIAAENPDISPNKAITLSRKMMYGHKWECFVFSLSFFGWSILNTVTMGLSGVFFSNPYKMAAFSEYYTELRKVAKEGKLEGSEYMNDLYLFEKADEALLLGAYQDVIDVLVEQIVEPTKKKKGIRNFIADVFGITLFNQSEEAQYERNQERIIKAKMYQAAVEKQVYPSRLAATPINEKRRKIETIHYMRRYSLWSLIMLFFIFSLIGWMWEVSLHLIADGVFVNRGVLHGPWLPIYGTGGLLILVVLNKARANPVLEFVCTVILCGCVEYFTSYYLEMTHDGKKWWDYSGYFLNLNGRICAEGLLVFGVGGMVIAYIAAPLIDNHLRKIKYSILIPICLLLVGAFAIDEVYSGKHPNTGAGITDYESRVEPQLEYHIEQYAKQQNSIYAGHPAEM